MHSAGKTLPDGSKIISDGYNGLNFHRSRQFPDGRIVHEMSDDDATWQPSEVQGGVTDVGAKKRDAAVGSSPPVVTARYAAPISGIQAWVFYAAIAWGGLVTIGFGYLLFHGH